MNEFARRASCSKKQQLDKRQTEMSASCPAFYLFSTYYFQSIMKPKAAFVVSVTRGIVISGIMIMLLPVLFDGNALWFAMPITKLVVMFYATWQMSKYCK